MASASLNASLAEYEGLLEHFLSPVLAHRNQAEAFIKKHLGKQYREQFLFALVNLLRQSAMPEVRSLSAIILRKKLPVGEPVLYHKLSVPLQREIKSGLLGAMSSESLKSIRHQICDTIGELTTVTLYQGDWEELVPFLFQCVSSGSPALRESVLHIFGRLAEISTMALEEHLAALLSVFQSCLVDADNSVQVAALTASCNCMRYLEQDKQRLPFRSLIPIQVQLVGNLLSRGMAEEAQQALQALVDVAYDHAKLFSPHLDYLVTAMFAIGSSDAVESGVRQLALEFLVGLARSAPAMARKSAHFIQQSFGLAMLLLHTVEEDPEFDVTPEPTFYDDTCFDTALSALDRLADAIKGRKAIPVVFHYISQYMSQADWKYRHGALMALTQVVEFMPLESLPEVVKQVLVFVHDAHSRVRYAALNALGQLALDFSPNLQTSLHFVVVPALIHALSDVSPRVQAHAAAAFIHYCEACPMESLTPYLDPLLAVLCSLLQSGTRMVQTQVITAVATIAEAAAASFVKFYDAFAVPLKHAITCEMTSQEDKFFRARSIECLTLMGQAVGPSQFSADAHDIMRHLYALHSRQALSNEDPFRIFMFQAFSRICGVLLLDFVPYLPHIMPVLLETAAIEPRLTELAQDNDDDDDELNHSNGQSNGAHQRSEFLDAAPEDEKRKFSIKTSVLEEKDTALTVLSSFANDLKADFFPWVDQSAKVVIPAINYAFSTDIRASAISVAPFLLTSCLLVSARSAEAKSLLGSLFCSVVSSVCMAVKIETDLNTLVILISEFETCLDICVSELGSLTSEQLATVGSVFSKVLVGTLKRISKRAEKRRDEGEEGVDEEEDQEDGEDEEAADLDLCLRIARCLGVFLKSHRIALLPAIHPIFEEVAPLLDPKAEPELQKMAVYVFDDVLENCGTAAIEFVPFFMPHLYRCALHEYIPLRQAAVYGLGICAASLGSSLFAPHLEATVRALVQSMSLPDAQSADSWHATDNAVAGLAKLLSECRDSPLIDQESLIPLWLAALPLHADASEGPKCYGFLCDLIESDNAALLGRGLQRLPMILQLLASVLGTPFVDDSVTGRIMSILKSMLGGFPRPMLESVLATLPTEARRRLAEQVAPHLGDDAARFLSGS